MKTFRLYDVSVTRTIKYDWVDIKAETLQEAQDDFEDNGIDVCSDTCFSSEGPSFENEWFGSEEIDEDGNPIDEDGNPIEVKE